MSLPYFPMFPSDFEAKTSHLTLEEDGAYNRLLRLMWMTPGCSLPDDDKWIMRRMRVDEDTFRRVVLVVIDEFCERKNGRVSNARLASVFHESTASHKKRVFAGLKGGKAKSSKNNDKDSSNAQAMLKQPEPEPDIDSLETDVSKDAAGVLSADRESESLEAVIVDAASKAIWDRGVPFLVERGVPDKQARSCIGRWLRDFGSSAVFDALKAAKQAGTKDPIPYVTQTLVKQAAPQKTGADEMAEILRRTASAEV